MSTQKTQTQETQSQGKKVPLGVLLSEKVMKNQKLVAGPSSGTWTGGADSKTPDPDT